MKYLIFLLLFSVMALAQSVCEDGEIRDCQNQLGICAGGTQVCAAGVWSPCSATPKEADICNNNLDDNCNGITNENCICQEGEVEECGIDIGLCEKGIRTCTGGKWTSCSGPTYVPSIVEICKNGFDDDCDGFCDYLNATCLDNTLPGDDNCPEIDHCSNRIKDFDEEIVDCGGLSCKPCANCTDGWISQILGEIKANVTVDNRGTIKDCGGICGTCPSCFDNIQNQNEEEIDCGGTLCPDCIEELLPPPEIPDCIKDDFCDESAGETIENCPEDCKSGTGFIFFILIVIFILIMLFIFLIFAKRLKKKQAKQDKVKIHSFLLKPPPKNIKSEKIAEEIKRRIR